MSDNIPQAAGFELGPDEDIWEMEFDQDAEVLGPITDFEWEGEGSWAVTHISRSGERIGYLPFSEDAKEEEICESTPGAEEEKNKGKDREENDKSENAARYENTAGNENTTGTESTAGAENTARDENDNINHDEDVMIVHDENHGLVEYFPYTGRMRYWSLEIHQYVDFFSQTVIDEVNRSGALGPGNPKYVCDLFDGFDGEHIRHENEQGQGAEEQHDGFEYGFSDDIEEDGGAEHVEGEH